MSSTRPFCKRLLSFFLREKDQTSTTKESTSSGGSHTTRGNDSTEVGRGPEDVTCYYCRLIRGKGEENCIGCRSNNRRCGRSRREISGKNHESVGSGDYTLNLAVDVTTQTSKQVSIQLASKSGGEADGRARELEIMSNRRQGRSSVAASDRESIKLATCEETERCHASPRGERWKLPWP